MQNIRFKLYQGDSVRRFRLPFSDDISDLQQQLQKKLDEFGLPMKGLRWIDADGDKIECSTGDDLLEALHYGKGGEIWLRTKKPKKDDKKPKEDNEKTLVKKSEKKKRRDRSSSSDTSSDSSSNSDSSNSSSSDSSSSSSSDSDAEGTLKKGVEGRGPHGPHGRHGRHGRHHSRGRHCPRRRRCGPPPFLALCYPFFHRRRGGPHGHSGHGPWGPHHGGHGPWGPVGPHGHGGPPHHHGHHGGPFPPPPPFGPWGPHGHHQHHHGGPPHGHKGHKHHGGHGPHHHGPEMSDGSDFECCSMGSYGGPAGNHAAAPLEDHLSELTLDSKTSKKMEKRHRQHHH